MIKKLQTTVKTIAMVLFVIIAFGSCSTTKYVPEGQYLLNKTKIEIDSCKNLSGSSFKSYLRQKENSEVFGFWKLELQLYSLSGRDSSKWINRIIRRMGEEPEIYDDDLTVQSVRQLEKALENKGYYEGTVDTTIKIKKRRVSLTYKLIPRTPYTIQFYGIDIPHDTLRLATTRRTGIKQGMLFDSDQLNTERERIATMMRRMGFYHFDKEYLAYSADTTVGDHKVNLTIHTAESFESAPDSIRTRIFTKYKISDVVFFQQSDTSSHKIDTLKQDGYTFLYQGKKMLRRKTLIKKCRIRPGDTYNELFVDRTYSNLNALGAVKYVSIYFLPVDSCHLRCFVMLNKAKVHTVSADLEGTFSAGDWGIAAGVGYANRNLFRGAEEFTLNGRLSYEWRQGGGRALEAKMDAGLLLPNNLKFNIGYSFQRRPDEFTRTIANASMQYHFLQNRNRWHHYFNLIDISYVYLPWISDAFRQEFLQDTNPLKYSYENHFIVSWSYNASYSSYSKRNPLRNYTTLNFGIETAGNALYGISKLFDLPKNDDGRYLLLKIPYAQYVKADFSVTYNQIFSKQHRLVYHAALGIAIPFGNAEAIPFEKRYFAGGANSVRGWTMRSLGPGAYRGSKNKIDYNNQSGDIKLDLNLEYRVKVIGPLEFAFFTDAGNVWTLRYYESQDLGQFHFKDFYKYLGWSYGAGLRLDFNFFVFRIDWGCKLYDPSRLSFDSETPNKSWRTAKNGLGWKDDMTLHFAIGYPF